MGNQKCKPYTGSFTEKAIRTTIERKVGSSKK
jgi:hypothetical protein